jgi:Asp/Glu/hydantoin racemase
MNTLVINPSSGLDMTKAIHKAAEHFAGGEFQVECLHNPEMPEFI